MRFYLFLKKVMGVIAMDKKQITLYYSSKNSLGKQLNAYIESSEKNI